VVEGPASIRGLVRPVRALDGAEIPVVELGSERALLCIEDRPGDLAVVVAVRDRLVLAVSGEVDAVDVQRDAARIGQVLPDERARLHGDRGRRLTRTASAGCGLHLGRLVRFCPARTRGSARVPCFVARRTAGTAARAGNAPFTRALDARLAA